MLTEFKKIQSFTKKNMGIHYLISYEDQNQFTVGTVVLFLKMIKTISSNKSYDSFTTVVNQDLVLMLEDERA